MSAQHTPHSVNRNPDAEDRTANIRLAWIIGIVALLLYVAGFFIQR
ncbi:hypothetical protein [Propionivibrio sp.]